MPAEKKETEVTGTDMASDKVPDAVNIAIDKVRKESENITSSIIGGGDAEVNETQDTDTDDKVQDDTAVNDKKQVDDKTPAAEANSEQDASEEVYEEIDQRLVDAGRKFGWSDERIEAVASVDIGVLEEIAAAIENESKETKAEADKVEIDQATIDKLSVDYPEIVDSVLKPLTKELGTLKEQLRTINDKFSVQDQIQEKQRIAEKFYSANRLFDEQVKTFPELGQFKELPKLQNGKINPNSPQFKARAKIYETAEIWEAAGHDWGKAIEQAFVWYGGLSGESKIEQKLINDINENKKLHIARPSHKKVDRKNLTPDEAANMIVQNAMEKAGYKG